MLQRADRDCGARRIDRHSATVRVGNGDDVVNIGEARQQLGADAARRVLHGRRDALHGGRNAENIARTDGTIGVSVTFEGEPIQRRKRRGDSSRQRQIVERGRRRQIHQLFAHPRAFLDAPVGAADILAIADHGLAGLDRAQRHLVALRDALARAEALRVHYNADVVVGVYADEHRDYFSALVPLEND